MRCVQNRKKYRNAVAVFPRSFGIARKPPGALLVKNTFLGWGGLLSLKNTKLLHRCSECTLNPSLGTPVHRELNFISFTFLVQAEISYTIPCSILGKNIIHRRVFYSSAKIESMNHIEGKIRLQPQIHYH